MFFLILAAVAAIAIGTAITWAAVENWIQANLVPSGTAQIVGQRLASGKYSVVAGVFSSTSGLVAQKTWESDQLDPELARRLDENGGTIVVRT